MPLEIYRRNGIWNYRGTIGPAGRRRRLRGSLRTKDKDIAARQVAEITETDYFRDLRQRARTLRERAAGVNE